MQRASNSRILPAPGPRMTDMRLGWLLQAINGDHSVCTLSVRVAHCPPPPVARRFSNPSWKVIVSASRGQYLKPGSCEPGFFSSQTHLRRKCSLASARKSLISCRQPLIASQTAAGAASASARWHRFAGYVHAAAPVPSVDSLGRANHLPMITNPCAPALSKKAPLPGTSDRRAR
jgi:hypothetical protein